MSQGAVSIVMSKPNSAAQVDSCQAIVPRSVPSAIWRLRAWTSKPVAIATSGTQTKNMCVKPPRLNARTLQPNGMGRSVEALNNVIPGKLLFGEIAHAIANHRRPLKDTGSCHCRASRLPTAGGQRAGWLPDPNRRGVVRRWSPTRDRSWAQLWNHHRPMVLAPLKSRHQHDRRIPADQWSLWLPVYAADLHHWWDAEFSLRQSEASGNHFGQRPAGLPVRTDIRALRPAGSTAAASMHEDGHGHKDAEQRGCGVAAS